ncbi:hypothetical protein [Streptomyces sp. NPDC048002]|uniref:hypothetical protein n=1 Tax=Streptomyces sp. NPDC048002 TaxID=3154344 RepID=UPI0033E4AE94
MSGNGGAPPSSGLATVRASRSRRNLLLAVIAAALIGLLVGAAIAWAISRDGGAAAPAPAITTTTTEIESPDSQGVFALTGTFELADGAVADGAGGCQGADGYADIFEGAAVTVYDAAGTVIATGSLGESSLAGGKCSFEVNIADVPRGESFYQVEVSHRGTVQLTREEAEFGLLSATLG